MMKRVNEVTNFTAAEKKANLLINIALIIPTTMIDSKQILR
jgi:hypothetical protein